MRTPSTSRRGFLIQASTVIAGLAIGARPVRALAASAARGARPGGHPDPRPGIDASGVLPADAVPAAVADAYEMVREIPGVVDGIRCQCGCAELPGMYSLLSCYEESGMAMHCEICQGEARLAYRLHGDGRTLDEIRAAVDRRFG